MFVEDMIEMRNRASSVTKICWSYDRVLLYSVCLGIFPCDAIRALRKLFIVCGPDVLIARVTQKDDQRSHPSYAQKCACSDVLASHILDIRVELTGSWSLAS